MEVRPPGEPVCLPQVSGPAGKSRSEAWPWGARLVVSPPARTGLPGEGQGDWSPGSRGAGGGRPLQGLGAPPGCRGGALRPRLQLRGPPPRSPGREAARTATFLPADNRPEQKQGPATAAGWPLPPNNQESLGATGLLGGRPFLGGGFPQGRPRGSWLRPRVPGPGLPLGPGARPARALLSARPAVWRKRKRRRGGPGVWGPSAPRSEAPPAASEPRSRPHARGTRLPGTPRPRSTWAPPASPRRAGREAHAEVKPPGAGPAGPGGSGEAPRSAGRGGAGGGAPAADRGARGRPRRRGRGGAQPGPTAPRCARTSPGARRPRADVFCYF